MMNNFKLNKFKGNACTILLNKWKKRQRAVNSGLFDSTGFELISLLLIQKMNEAPVQERQEITASRYQETCQTRPSSFQNIFQIN